MDGKGNIFSADDELGGRGGDIGDVSSADDEFGSRGARVVRRRHRQAPSCFFRVVRVGILLGRGCPGLSGIVRDCLGSSGLNIFWSGIVRAEIICGPGLSGIVRDCPGWDSC